MRTRAFDKRVAGLAAGLAALALLAAAVVNNPMEEAHAQGATGVNYFLEIDGIEGASTDDRRLGQIEIESWSWGESNPRSPVSRSTGKVAMKDFTFTMKTSKASPKLFLACAKGKIIPSATLTATNSSGQDYIVWELKEVIVSSYKPASSGSGDTVPTESMSLNFEKIIFTYTPQNPDGSLGAPIRAGWNRETNRKI
jgi:type VI secretion system secreted protein Hcp